MTTENSVDSIRVIDDYDRFLNYIGKNREPSLIRKMGDLTNKAKPGTVALAGGFPASPLFPFRDATFNLSEDKGGSIKIDSSLMEIALQYGPTVGYPRLLEKAECLCLKYHNPPRWNDRMIAITSGAQDGFARAIEMTISPGDFIVVEQPSFCGALAVMKPYDLNYVSVGIDEYGMIPDELRKALSKWKSDEVRNATEGVPKVLYLVPSAANPTGITIIVERRKQIYEIASEYNLLILEDDPYYFLQYEEPEMYPPSFLSMDTDGRVLRFDSFSKIISPGLRLGFVTGPKILVQKIVFHSEISILHPCSMSQVLVTELWEHWGEKGFEEQIKNVRKFYLNQRNLMMEAANSYLNGLAEWYIPTGGMFLWIKCKGVTDTHKMCTERALAKGLLLLPGNVFNTDQQSTSPYIRCSYSGVSFEEMKKGMKLLSELIREDQILN